MDQDSVPSAMLQNMRPWVETLETDIGDDGEGGMMAARNDLLTDERDPLWHFFDDPLDSNTYFPHGKNGSLTRKILLSQYYCWRSSAESITEKTRRFDVESDI